MTKPPFNGFEIGISPKVQKKIHKSFVVVVNRYRSIKKEKLILHSLKLRLVKIFKINRKQDMIF